MLINHAKILKKWLLPVLMLLFTLGSISAWSYTFLLARKVEHAIDISRPPKPTPLPTPEPTAMMTPAPPMPPSTFTATTPAVTPSTPPAQTPQPSPSPDEQNADLFALPHVQQILTQLPPEFADFVRNAPPPLADRIRNSSPEDTQRFIGMIQNMSEDQRQQMFQQMRQNIAMMSGGGGPGGPPDGRPMPGDMGRGSRNQMQQEGSAQHMPQQPLPVSQNAPSMPSNTMMAGGMPGGGPPAGGPSGIDQDRDIPQSFLELIRQKALFGRAPEQNWQLGGILGDSVMLNGQWFKRDQPGPVTIKDIQPNKVTIEVNGQTRELSLWPMLPGA